jgi:hypothetical protein
MVGWGTKGRMCVVRGATGGVRTSTPEQCSGHTSIMHCFTERERERQVGREGGRIAWYFRLFSACVLWVMLYWQVRMEEGYVQMGLSQVEPLNA